MIGHIPIGMFIDVNNTIYVNDRHNNRIQIWYEGDVEPSTVVIINLNFSIGIFVTNNGDIYLDNGLYNGHVDKWSKSSNTSVPVMYVDGSCFGLFVDNNNNLYCSLPSYNRVVKQSLDNDINMTIAIAGNGTCQQASNTLCHPTQIFVDINFNLYVVDFGNDRIQLFEPEKVDGRTLVGKDTSENIRLNRPTDIKIDADGNLFIVDKNNHRILRFGSNGLHCIIGCSSSFGTKSDQLNSPYGIAFDTYGNIFVLDEGNDRIQKFLLAKNTCLPYNQPKICPNATWNEHGITYVNKSIVNDVTRGIFIDSNDTLYVAVHSKNQIIIRFEKSIDPVQHLNATLFDYTSLFVSINGDIYFSNGEETGRVERWIKNSMSIVLVAYFSGNCFGLFIDNNNTLYCSLLFKHRVDKISLIENTNIITTVAGTNFEGSASDELSKPWGIFIDTNFNLYVADSGNNRIQRFRPGETNGTTVAGNGIPNNLILKLPTDIVMDADGYLFIADNRHRRIIRSGYNEYQCVAGCINSSDSTSNELKDAYALRFDSYGNIYVSDEYNYRIQKFTLTTNFCETSITTISPNEHITSSSFVTHKQELSIFLTPPTCKNTKYIGFNCSIFNTPCEMLKPCQHAGTCNNIHTNHYDYTCSCVSGFSGTNCEIDHRPCKPYTCLNHGICNETSNTTFNCICNDGWQGINCESMINYCDNITCMNNGVCRPLLLNYTCECLGNSYSGRYCDIVSKKIIIYKIVSKSFAYVAIIAMISVALFVIVMDILKYCFGIDPTREELERIRRKKQAQKRKHPVIQRFIYVNAPLPSSEESISINKQTTVLKSA